MWALLKNVEKDDEGKVLPDDLAEVFGMSHVNFKTMPRALSSQLTEYAASFIPSFLHLTLPFVPVGYSYSHTRNGCLVAVVVAPYLWTTVHVLSIALLLLSRWTAGFSLALSLHLRLTFIPPSPPPFLFQP